MVNKFPTNQSFQRLTNFPLDETTVFDTLAQAQDYAKNNPTAYKGQVLHVKDARTDTEINNDVNIYEETCYIDLLKNIVPICSFSYEAMGLFFDIIYEIFDGPTEETRNKLDKLYEIMYDNYAHDFNEMPTGDYHTQPWHPLNYNDYQICLKMTTACSDKNIGSGYFSATGAGYTIENITINDSYYTVISFNNEQLPTKISFKNGDCIEKVIHMCDTSQLTDMEYMFDGCSSLTQLDASTWDTSNVTNMNYMFQYCSSLINLDVSTWDTSNVTNMWNMFCGCKTLTSLNISNWNTSNVTSMHYMFSECKALTQLDLSNWNTEKVTGTSQMFYNCKSLTTLDVSNLVTTKVRDMSNMFNSCNSLTELNISNWDISNSASTNGMFYGCFLLELSNIKMDNCSQKTITKITEAYNVR